MSQHMIGGVQVPNRGQNALQVHPLLTGYVGHVKTRLGSHEVDEKSCSTGGLLLLEMSGDAADNLLRQELAQRHYGLQISGSPSR